MNRSSTRSDVGPSLKRIFCLGVLLPTLGIAAVGGVASIAEGAGSGHQSTPPSERVCFPAGKWDAEQGKRPCARITHVYEDGSAELQVLDADGTERYTVGVSVPDTYGESR